MLSCAVLETLLRLTLAEPSMVLGTHERALLPATLKSTTPSEGPRSCPSDVGITLAVKVTCSHRFSLESAADRVSSTQEKALLPFALRSTLRLKCQVIVCLTPHHTQL
jgi:hypothetical protein